MQQNRPSDENLKPQAQAGFHILEERERAISYFDGPYMLVTENSRLLHTNQRAVLLNIFLCSDSKYLPYLVFLPDGALLVCSKK